MVEHGEDAINHKRRLDGRSSPEVVSLADGFLFLRSQEIPGDGILDVQIIPLHEPAATKLKVNVTFYGEPNGTRDDAAPVEIPGAVEVRASHDGYRQRVGFKVAGRDK